MRTIVAIDPGFSLRGQGCAVAVFTADVLQRVYFTRPETVCLSALPALCASEVVWERPQTDARTLTCMDSVVELACVGGVLAGMIAGACGCRAVSVTPSLWKGSTPKPIAHGRMWTTLAPGEREVLGGAKTHAAIDAAKRKGGLDRWGKPGGVYYPASFVEHNLLDACGVGLWRIGRGQNER